MKTNKEKLLIMKDQMADWLRDIRKFDKEYTLTSDSLILTSRRCRIWDVMIETNMKNIDCCGACHAFWQRLAETLDSNMSLEITKSLARGDDVCEYVYKIEAT